MLSSHYFHRVKINVSVSTNRNQQLMNYFILFREKIFSLTEVKVNHTISSCKWQCEVHKLTQLLDKDIKLWNRLLAYNRLKLWEFY